MAPSRPRLRLTRAMRMRDSRQFSALRAEGRRLASGCVLANWRVLPAEATSRVGVITSRRLGSAVVRNRARRLLREAFRLHQQDLARPIEAVFVARGSIVGKPLVTVERDVMALLRRAELLREA